MYIDWCVFLQGLMSSSSLNNSYLNFSCKNRDHSFTLSEIRIGNLVVSLSSAVSRFHEVLLNARFLCSHTMFVQSYFRIFKYSISLISLSFILVSPIMHTFSLKIDLNISDLLYLQGLLVLECSSNWEDVVDYRHPKFTKNK